MAHRVTSPDRVTIYVFRDPRFAPAGDTFVSAAPLEAVVRVFGGGGIKDTAGLLAAFGGAAVFRNDATGKYHLGVWGVRKTAKEADRLICCFVAMAKPDPKKEPELHPGAWARFEPAVDVGDKPWMWGIKSPPQHRKRR